MDHKERPTIKNTIKVDQLFSKGFKLAQKALPRKEWFLNHHLRLLCPNQNLLSSPERIVPEIDNS